MKKYVIGLDFGTLSGRALLVDVATGEEIGESVLDYAHGVMSEVLPDGTPLPKDAAVQHPQDYVDVLAYTIRDVLKKNHVDASQVIGVGVDFTASTILPVDKDLKPLCLRPEFASRSKAYVTLWKDHTAAPQAAKIDEVAARMNAPFFPYVGHSCPVENGLAKMLCILQNDPEVYEAAYRILEAQDWVNALMTGTEKKGFNAACAKEFWCKDWGGYPSKEFLKALDPRFENLVEDKLGGDTVSYDPCFGMVSEAGAELTGLAVGTAVAFPIIDSYAAMPVCGVTGADGMVLSVGTSLGQMFCSELDKVIPGVFASCPGGMYEGLTSYEFGQTGGGDILAWYLDNCLPASYVQEAETKRIGIHDLLRQKMEEKKPGESGLVALDWLNGNRSILNDAELSGLILGLTLRTKPEDIYRALMESIVFGTKRIVEAVEEAGIAITKVIACGGIARKNEFMMQMFADVLGCPVYTCGSRQAAALGAALNGAVAAGSVRGGYDSIEEAAAVMARLNEKVFEPREEYQKRYEKLYAEYRLLYEEFGKKDSVMKRLYNV